MLSLILYTTSWGNRIIKGKKLKTRKTGKYKSIVFIITKHHSRHANTINKTNLTPTSIKVKSCALPSYPSLYKGRSSAMIILLHKKNINHSRWSLLIGLHEYWMQSLEYLPIVQHAIPTRQYACEVVDSSQ